MSTEVIDAETGEVLQSTDVDDTPNHGSLAPLIVRHEEKRGLVLTCVDDVEKMSKRLAMSELVPQAFREKPANVFLALNMGLELGLSPAASLRAIHVVDGKPGLAADAMVGIVMASGAARSFVCIESNERIAIYEAVRVGSDRAVRKSFTIEEAEQANLLGKDNWKKYPIRMLEARAKAALARDLFPDVLHGIYTPDELAATAVIEARTVLDELKDALFDVKTIAELERVGQRAFVDLGSTEQDVFRPLYKEVKAALEKAGE